MYPPPFFILNFNFMEKHEIRVLIVTNTNVDKHLIVTNKNVDKHLIVTNANVDKHLICL